MPTVPGGLFDSSSTSPSHGAAISSLLDSLGLSESSIRQATVSSTGTNTITDASATFVANPGGTTSVVLSGSVGNTLIVTGSGNTSIVGGAGYDTVLGGRGSDTIIGGLGSSTVIGGGSGNYIDGQDGNDVLSGSGGADTLIGGAGNDTLVGGKGNDIVIIGEGNDTVDGGAGFDVARMSGSPSDYTVTGGGNDGRLLVRHGTTGSTTDISNIQYVQLDNGNALVFAQDTQQAAITTLYETTFGRTADASGLQYWFDRAAAGESLDDIARSFTASPEFAATSGQLDNTAFVQALYQQTFARDADPDGLAYWVSALTSGGATRAQLIHSFASIATQNIDGSIHTEATVVGSVTIVHNIV